MKFTLRDNSNLRTKLIYLQKSDTFADLTDGGVFESPGRIDVESPESAEFNRAEIGQLHTDGAVSYFREKATRAEAAYRVDDPMGVLPDAEKAFWNPRQWWRIIFQSKRPVLDVLEKTKDIPEYSYRNSNYNYSRLEQSVLSRTYDSTLDSIKGSGRNLEGVSLTAIGHWEKTSSGVFQEIQQDFREAKKDIIPKLDKQERWKKIAKFFYLPFQKTRLNFLFNQQERSLEQGVAETKQILASLREQRTRHLENIQKASINPFFKQARDSGKDQDLANFWELVSEITQNPESFLQSPQASYAGISWRQAFNVDNPIDLLETFNEFGWSDKAISMQAMDRSDRDASTEIDRFSQRHQIAGEQLQNTDFKGIMDYLYGQSIEMSDEANIKVSKVVFRLQDAVAQIQPNIDIEQDIFNGQSIIRLTANEKLLHFMSYFSQNPQRLDALNDQTKQILLRYLFDTNNSSKSLYATGGLRENTLENQKIVLRTARRVVDSAQEVFALLPSLSEKVKSKNSTEAQEALRKLEEPTIYYKQLLSLLGVNQLEPETDYEEVTIPPENEGDEPSIERRAIGTQNFPPEGSLLAKLSEPQQISILNVKEYQPLIEDINEKLSGLKSERETFESEVIANLPPDPETYNDNKAQFNNLLSLIAAAGQAPEGSTEQATAQAQAQQQVAAMRAQGGNFSILGGEFETRESNLQNLAEQIRQIIERWDNAEARFRGETFDNLPADTSALGGVLLNRVKSVIVSEQQDIGDIYDNLDEADEIDTAPEVTDMNGRLQRWFGDETTRAMEQKYLEQHEASVQDQWNLLRDKPRGFILDHFEYANVTNLEGEFTLSSALSHRNIFQDGTQNLPLRIVEQKSDSILMETSHHVIRMKAPKRLSTAEGNRANLAIWHKTPEQVGPLSENKPFKVDFQNPDQFGIYLTSGPRNNHQPTQIGGAASQNLDQRPHPAQDRLAA